MTLTARQSVVQLTVRIPMELHRRLGQRAQSKGTSLNQTVIQALERTLTQDEPALYELTERQRVLKMLRDSGMLAEPEDFWDRYIQMAPDATLEQVRAIWEGQPPLSEDIIAERGER